MLSKPETPYKPFPLFKLPMVAANEVMLCMPIVDIYNFSTVNSKTKGLVKTFTSQKLRYILEIRVDLFQDSCIEINHRKVGLWQIEIKSSEETDQDNYVDGITWNLFVPDVLASCMFQTDYITELFNTPITSFYFDISVFKSQNQLIIDWLLSRQNTIQDYAIVGEELVTDDFLAIWHRIPVVTKYLELHLIVMPSFQCDIAIKQQELCVCNAEWFTLDSLLKADCSRIFLDGSELTSIELNRFLRSWLLSESNRNLKSFEIRTNENILLEQVLDLPIEATDENELEERRTLSTIYESGQFDQTLYNDLTLYTAKDEETDETLVSNRSDFEYTNDAISLKSAHGYLNLSPSEPDATLDRTQTEENCSMNYYTHRVQQNINSNRSSTCIAPTFRSTISRASVISLRQNLLESHQAHAQNAPALPQAPPPNSIRQGALRVAYLAKKFECKKSGKKSENSEKIRSPPLEVLFPPLPVQQLQEEDLKSLKSLKSPRVSKLDFTPSKKSMKGSMKNMELDS